MSKLLVALLVCGISGVLCDSPSLPVPISNDAYLGKLKLVCYIVNDATKPDYDGLKIISRRDWLAQPPQNELPSLELPLKRVIIAHTATENCTTQVCRTSCDFLRKYWSLFI